MTIVDCSASYAKMTDGYRSELNRTPKTRHKNTTDDAKTTTMDDDDTGLLRLWPRKDDAWRNDDDGRKRITFLDCFGLRLAKTLMNDVFGLLRSSQRRRRMITFDD